MKSVMVPETAEEAWGAGKGELVNDFQKEGIRQILAWMYRNCLKTSESKEPFVYKLTKASPEKLLLMFYLLEKGHHETPTTGFMTSAINDYVPDLDKFKDKVVSTKFKFWKRMHTGSSDSIIGWTRIGFVARFVLENSIIDDYVKDTKESKEADA